MPNEKNGLFLDPTLVPENGTIARQIAQRKGETSPVEVQGFRDENALTLDITNVLDVPGDPSPISFADFERIGEEALKAHRQLLAGEGDCLDKGLPMLGWQSLPEKISKEHLERIKSVASELSEKIDAFVSLGIGGSYLGIEATIKALTHNWFNQLSPEQRGGAPEIYFLGNNVDPDYFRDTLDLLKGKRVGVNVISKSGTTTETAIAFRVMRKLLEGSFGDAADQLIIATTDPDKGALRTLTNRKGYESFVVPDDVGGRFTVLTDVGLLGIAMAGIDIEELIAGAAEMRRRTQSENFMENPALVHAAARTLAYRNGKKVEVIATNSASLYHVGRFAEQLFPESEGKEGKGLWVSPSLYSEKLHANGQMVQQGERNILETFLFLANHDSSIRIPEDSENLDQLNYLCDQKHDVNYVNEMVIEGTAYAHFNGGVPNMTIRVPRRSAYCLGQLYYLFERSVAVSGYLLGVNPFVQPGVEDYKRAVFALMDKPGFEDEGKDIRARIAGRKKVLI
jgi:glucose-6-phosphate isomerase